MKAGSSRPASQPASSPASQPEASPPDELAIYRATYTLPIDREIVASAARWRLSPYLLRGLFYTESHLDNRAINESTDSVCAAQLSPGGRAAVTNLRRARGVFRALTRARALRDVRECLDGGAELLRYFFDICGGMVGNAGVVGVTGGASNAWCALAGYNTGNVRARVERFVRAVEKHMNRFRVEAGLPPWPSLRWQRVERVRRVVRPRKVRRTT